MLQQAPKSEASLEPRKSYWLALAPNYSGDKFNYDLQRMPQALGSGSFTANGEVGDYWAIF